ncbi:hypothetical protein ACL03H_19780 [Saccharopolyspora sp. MS10]|uniref:hypothetical protein n=1 Tax=Saccharopolyspora sp. MS10 TaxID=3385973 RepID=UPI0039A0AC57
MRQHSHPAPRISTPDRNSRPGPAARTTEPIIRIRPTADPAFRSRALLPRGGPVVELIRGTPKIVHIDSQPPRLSAEETARTEELVNELLDAETPVAATPASPGLRVSVGALCTALTLSAAVATAALSGAAPADARLAQAGPEPVDGVAAALGPVQAVSARSAPGTDPAAAREPSVVASAREFYAHLDRSPAQAGPRLAPGLPADFAWGDVASVRVLRLRAESPERASAVVEIAHRDGSRSVLRHRLELGAGGIAARLLSLQHFPR